jgi:hypothetical protein
MGVGWGAKASVPAQEVDSSCCSDCEFVCECTGSPTFCLFACSPLYLPPPPVAVVVVVVCVCLSLFPLCLCPRVCDLQCSCWSRFRSRFQVVVASCSCCLQSLLFAVDVSDSLVALVVCAIFGDWCQHLCLWRVLPLSLSPLVVCPICPFPLVVCPLCPFAPFVV